MRVRLLTSIACPLGVWKRDDVAELPNAMALDLIGVGAAVSLEPPPRGPVSAPEAAILPAPETTTLPRARRRSGER